MGIYRYVKKTSDAEPSKGIPASEKENEENQSTVPPRQEKVKPSRGTYESYRSVETDTSQ